MNKLILISTLLLNFAFATPIAIIDSGVDYKHEVFAGKMWNNPGEIPDNYRDDDNNSYQDDLYGWNFAENNNLVIDYNHLGTFSQDVYRFFEIQGKMMIDMATEEEIAWLRKKLEDSSFVSELQKFGNFIHGTHVAGIAAENNPIAEIMAIKLIPTQVSPFINALKSRNNSDKEDNAFRWNLYRQGVALLASQQAKMLEDIARYAGTMGAKVANGSFGTGVNQAKMLASGIYAAIFWRKLEGEDEEKAIKIFLDTMVEKASVMASTATETLFVFAAGNDANDNDKFATSPASIDADNVISVAATYKRNELARFSNYGEKTVDIAAPGMLINSAIPGNEYLKVSGTSQAAPFVANLASQIIDQNPDLTPKDVKKILMGTVDIKQFLQGKVVSNGMINTPRALFAAQASRSGDLDAAIASANQRIADLPESKDAFVQPWVIPMQMTQLLEL